MNKNHFILLVVLLIIFSSSIVFAQINPLETIADFFGNIGLGGVYEKAPTFFDSLILCIIFISVGMIALGKRFDTNAGKALIITLGIALAIAAELFLVKKGIHLQDIGPYAIAILIVILAYCIFKLLVDYLEMEKSTAGMLTIVVAFFILDGLLSDNISKFTSNDKYAMLIFLYSFLKAGMIIASIILVIKGFRHLFGAVSTEVKEIRGEEKNIKDDAKEIEKEAKATDTDLKNAEKAAEKGDDAKAKEELKITYNSLLNEIEGMKKAINTIQGVAVSLKKIAKSQKATEKEIAGVNEDIDLLAAKYNEMIGAIRKKASIAEEVKKTATAPEAVKPEQVAAITRENKRFSEETGLNMIAIQSILKHFERIKNEGFEKEAKILKSIRKSERILKAGESFTIKEMGTIKELDNMLGEFIKALKAGRSGNEYYNTELNGIITKIRESKELGNKVCRIVRWKGIRTAKRLSEIMPNLMGQVSDIGGSAKVIEKELYYLIEYFQAYKKLSFNEKIRKENIDVMDEKRNQIKDKIYNEISALLDLEGNVEEEEVKVESRFTSIPAE